MKVQKINNDMSFGMRDINGKYFEFKLSSETLNSISSSTKLSIEELHRLPMNEAMKLMKERGAIKEPNKIFQWLSEKYKAFGEKTGLLKKQRKIYTHDKIIYM